ncbi:MAG: SMP-30/gluconolactonase/LRE family protein [Caldilineaceae bacterium]
MAMDVQLLVDNRSLVGEGALWDEQAQVLYWVDILSNMLYCYDPTSGENRSWDVGQHVGTVVLRERGGVMLALRDGFAGFDLTTGALTMIADPEAHIIGNRFNDGKCDPGGRFWAGTMAYEDQSVQGSLYRLDADLSVHKMLEDIGISNGIVWSLDQRTMYYIDSIAHTVRAFDYNNKSGAISNERVVIQVMNEMGLPDGMAIDAEGMLWVAHFGGSCVRRWNPITGQIIGRVALPTAQITSCAFGGRNFDTLYITSAADGYDEEDFAREPHAGALFATQPGVRGVPTFRFAG